MGKKRQVKQQFLRRTITLPGELAPWADAQKSRPEHANNFSSYVRSLIIRDRQAAQNSEALTA